MTAWIYVLSALVGLLVVYLVTRKETKVALDPVNYQPFTLIKRIPVNHDSFVFRFAFKHPNRALGLPVGHHITIRAPCTDANGKLETVQHSYTPISSDDEKGYVDFLIKVYFSNVDPRFPHGGRLSQHIYNMKIGDSLEMRGPKGNFIYLGNGASKINVPGKGWVTSTVDAFAMVAGGTGITPLMQIIQAIYKNPSDKTRVFLLVSDHTEEDILLRGQLDVLVRQYPQRFHVWYTLTRKVSDTWSFDKGRITEALMRRTLPVPEKFGDSTVLQNADISSVKALLCGPNSMIQEAVKPGLANMGYTADMLFTF